jgi:hypothetical protein
LNLKLARLSLLWFAAGVMIASAIWGAVTSVVGVLLSGRMASFLPALVQGTVYALMLTPISASPHGFGLLAWPKVVEAFPRLEEGFGRIAIITALAALPSALIVAWSYMPRYPFWLSVFCAFLATWLGLFLPRVALRQLRPGVFRPDETQKAHFR